MNIEVLYDMEQTVYSVVVSYIDQRFASHSIITGTVSSIAATVVADTTTVNYTLKVGVTALGTKTFTVTQNLTFSTMSDALVELERLYNESDIS